MESENAPEFLTQVHSILTPLFVQRLVMHLEEFAFYMEIAVHRYCYFFGFLGKCL